LSEKQPKGERQTQTGSGPTKTSETAFTEVVALAKWLWKAPMAAISLFSGDTVRFLAASGLSQKEVVREEALCTHVCWSSGEVVVIEDTHKDPRTSDLVPVVGRPHIRFYAGAPLVVPSGHVLGVLNIYDVKPRGGTAEQVMALNMLARQAVTNLELSRHITELDQAVTENARLLAISESRLVVSRQLSDELSAQQRALLSANQRLEELATRDPLTHLRNRRYCAEYLDQLLGEPANGQLPVSVMVLDLDHFKSINESFGDIGGDEILKELANGLAEAVGPRGLLGRWGGESFIVILPKCPHKRSLRIAHQLHNLVPKLSACHNAISACLGVATSSESEIDGEALLKRATRALYICKNSGRDRVMHCDDLPIDLLSHAFDKEKFEMRLHDVFGMDNVKLLVPQNTGALINRKLKQSYDSIFESWAHLLAMRDMETEAHTRRVAELMERLAISIGMSPDQVLYAKWGAILHDVGKIAIPDEILRKPGKLDDDEWKVIRTHPTIAFEMLSPITALGPALDIPLYHHERWDGKGYPKGLKGEEIPLMARLFAVIDVFDALTSDRPYRPAWSAAETIAYISEQSGTHFDPLAVEAFTALILNEDAQPMAA